VVWTGYSNPGKYGFGSETAVLGTYVLISNGPTPPDALDLDVVFLLGIGVVRQKPSAVT